MKRNKFFPGILLILFFISLQSVHAQKKAGVRAPKQVVDSFHKFYPYIKKPVWAKTGENYQASFAWGETTSQLAFDKSGNWLFRRIVVSREQMPGSIPAFCDQNFPGVMPDIVYLTYYPDNKSTFYELHVAGRIFKFDSFAKIIGEVDK